MNNDQPKLFVILGPTAVGKSSLGIEISKRIGADIVNADSLQVYKYLDIGTAKPSPEQRKQAPHHLIDIVNPDCEFNAGAYRKLASDVICKLHESSKNILLIGGTYLYVRALLHGLIGSVSSDPEVRNTLRRLKSDFGVQHVFKKLEVLDPESASRIHPNDYIRIERALEAYYATGEKMSDLQAGHGFNENFYEALKIGLFEERDNIREKIDARVDRMIENGLVCEVCDLREMGYSPALKPMQSIGYKQINRYLDGEIALGEAIELTKRDTKRFAKRQMTWLRGDRDIEWVSLPNDHYKIMKKAETFFTARS